MNGEKFGKNVIKTTDGTFSRVFGTIKLPKWLHSGMLAKVKPFENGCMPFGGKQRILLGIDHEKRRPTATFFFGFQNRYLQQVETD